MPTFPKCGTSKGAERAGTWRKQGILLSAREKTAWGSVPRRCRPYGCSGTRAAAPMAWMIAMTTLNPMTMRAMPPLSKRMW